METISKPKLILMICIVWAIMFIVMITTFYVYMEIINYFQPKPSPEYLDKLQKLLTS